MGNPQTKYTLFPVYFCKFETVRQSQTHSSWEKTGRKGAQFLLIPVINVLAATISSKEQERESL